MTNYEGLLSGFIKKHNEFKTVMSNGRVIGLISGKGGVGKTSLTVNLGIALKQSGNEVTLIDADFSASNLGVYLGRYDHPVKMQKVLNGEASIEQGIFRHPTGVKALTSSNEIDQVEPNTEGLMEIFDRAAETSDYVLIDCPPGLNSTVEDIIDACDEIMIITMPTQTAGVNAAQIIEKCKEKRKPILGTILNKVDGDPEKELIEREVEMMTESHILSNIPYDKTMKEALFDNTPLILYDDLSPAAIEIKRLASEMDGTPYEEPKFTKIKRSLKKIKNTVSN